jgi:phosphomethylpyrimidine synthase
MDMSDTKNKSKQEIPSLKSLERDFGQKFAYPASTKTYLVFTQQIPDFRSRF